MLSMPNVRSLSTPDPFPHATGASFSLYGNHAVAPRKLRLSPSYAV